MLRAAHLSTGNTRPVHLGGWKRQVHDLRDAQYALKLHGSFTSRPTSVDLRSVCSEVEDQGELGSCTANMLAGMIEADENQRRLHAAGMAHLSAGNPPKVTVGPIMKNPDGSFVYSTTFSPGTIAPAPTPAPAPPAPPAPVPAFVQVSRLFGYYATRKLEGSVGIDSGASIRDTIKAGVQSGVADEASWAYDINKFTVNPPQSVWDSAAKHKIVSYHSIADGDIESMKSVLAEGYLVGFGFNVYSYFLSAEMAKNGILHKPSSSELFEGGHAVAICGYNDSLGRFLVRNSWSKDWGLSGYFWMDYNYVADTTYCNDFWVVKSSPIGVA